jgi:glucose/arabinose dehydrogenase
LAPIPGQPIPTPRAEDEKIAATIKVPPGFKVSVWMDGVPQAREIAWGDKGTLFSGSDVSGVITAIYEENGKRVAKPVIKGFKHDTGVAFMNHTLYVADPDKIYAWENPEDHLGDLSLANAKVVYDDFPAYQPHNWKALIPDYKAGVLYVNVGPPCSECIPPPDSAQLRKIYPATGWGELVAIGVRQVVGGVVDPRTGKLWFGENGRDWMGDDIPSDKLNLLSKTGMDYGYPFCHQGNLLDPVYGKGHSCKEFTPPVINLGAHVVPLGMIFYQGKQFPAEYKWNLFIAETGSWNRHVKVGYRVERVMVNQDGTNAKQEPFACCWNDGDKVNGRPTDVIEAPDGSILVADDQSSTIWQISYVGK